MTSASLLIVLIVGTVVGSLTGLLLGSSMAALYLAFLAGLLGTTIGAVVRNLIVSRGAGVGPDDFAHADAGDRLCRHCLFGRQRSRGRSRDFERGLFAGMGRYAGGSVFLDPARDADDHLPHEAWRRAQIDQELPPV